MKNKFKSFKPIIKKKYTFANIFLKVNTNLNLIVMKRILLFAIALCIGFMGVAQERTVFSKDLLKQSVLKEVVKPIDRVDYEVTQSYAPIKDFKSVVLLGDEVELLDTQYDLQTNQLLSNRLMTWPDGTITAVATMGLETPPSSPDRGTGYNYFDGNDWQEKPTERIEPDRCGWPNIAAWGAEGEIVVSHIANTAGDVGLYISRRPVRGEGEWETFTFISDIAGVDPTWPRIVTSGENNEYLHVFYNTYNGYGAMTAATLYARSSDGGTTWDVKDVMLEGMGEDSYVGISADDYALASRGNTVVLLGASAWFDMFMMKSTDNGDTWEKTVIWQHPFPMFDIQTQFLEDTLYAVGNSAELTIDKYGNCHVVYSCSRILRNEENQPGYYSTFPYYDGIGYWNESMEAPIPTPEEVPSWANYPEYYTLDPDYLYEELNVLIGWVQDVNGDGEINYVEVASGEFPFAIYRELGVSTMPTLTITDDDVIAVAYSSVTEGYATSDNRYNYRHNWVTFSPDLGNTWGTSLGEETFIDLQEGELFHIFDECIYGQFAPNNSSESDHFDFMYNADDKPGVFLDEDEQTIPTTNRMIYNKISKDEVVGVIDINNETENSLVVSNCYPNPTHGTTTLTISLRDAGSVALEIYNLTGQKVMEIPATKMAKGVNTITFDASALNSGVYFYTVTAGTESISKKMIVE